MVFIDRDAASVEAAANQHAREARALLPRTLLSRNSAALHALLVTAFIAGHSNAKRDTVAATDALLDRTLPQGVRP